MVELIGSNNDINVSNIPIPTGFIIIYFYLSLYLLLIQLLGYCLILYSSLVWIFYPSRFPIKIASIFFPCHRLFCFLRVFLSLLGVFFPANLFFPITNFSLCCVFFFYCVFFFVLFLKNIKKNQKKIILWVARCVFDELF